MDQYFISLGEGCSVAMMLREQKNRTEAYPFDWMINITPKSLLMALQDDFKQMIPREDEIIASKINSPIIQQMITEFNLNDSVAGDLELFGDYYPKIQDRLLELGYNFSLAEVIYLIKYRYNKNSVKQAYFFHNHYKMIFVHELTHKNIQAENVVGYNQFIDKTNRRIKRLQTRLSDTSNKLIFIHYSYTSLLKPMDTGKNNWQDLLKLSELITKKYPQLNFQIIAFNLIDKNLIVNKCQNIYFPWNFLKDKIRISRQTMTQIIKNKV